MSADSQRTIAANRAHSWLRKIGVALVPGPMTPLLQRASHDLLRQFERLGHEVQLRPNDGSDVLLTTALFEEPIEWREAPLFTARRRFRLDHLPTVYTLVHASSSAFQRVLDRLEVALSREPPDPADFAFPGLAPRAYHVLVEQGRRGGAILALERLVQAQAKSLRVVLVVGDERPLASYHFDLAGAYPCTQADDPQVFYEDIVLRIVTAASTTEVNRHQVVGEPVSGTLWQRLSTPAAVRLAGRELGRRSFFTEMVRITDLVTVPAVGEAVAEQYSEGCFATWDPELEALVATVTGSARPVDKGNITDDELAVIVGVRSDGQGALVRHVEGIRNDPPSSESVEMIDMDRALPAITLGAVWDTEVEVPVVRSKLHGHRGVASYDPRHVEHVPLDPPYYHYLVSCATEAQVRAIRGAFARSEALQDPDDPRQVVFTVLPGHGVVIVEKWVPGTVPFQVIWEFMDAGYLEIDNLIPQGPMCYVPDASGRLVLRTAEPSPHESG
ncbi:MAG: hypothetical protein M8467_06585 [Anaerolineae bacterium]|nr:hypothetical protein [Anaerolineae bacterium]